LIGNRNILTHCFKSSPLFGGGAGGDLVRKGLLLVLLMVLTVASAMAQKAVVNMGTVPMCETTQFSVVDWPGDRYTWDIYRDSTVNFAHTKGDVDPAGYFEKGMYEGSTVTVHWLDTGRYFIRVMVWDEVSCTNNLMLFRIEVINNPPMAEISVDSTCIGEPSIVRIVLTGFGPWDLKYTYVSEANGTNEISMNLNGQVEEEFTVSLPALPAGITEFWVDQIIDQCVENLKPTERARIVIYPKPTNKKIYPVNK